MKRGNVVIVVNQNYCDHTTRRHGKKISMVFYGKCRKCGKLMPYTVYS